ncbi:MAG: CoA transferase [Phenylobacterium sp.]|uniref:CaiB/BaiF CoA-transferase family protein n=1 Tax=Phenylobacterium sp. TaxID=1871053 RepID=UPI001A63A2B0|nr:CoA transferase [Phenylobacterium sp.]MBL8772058.1 CoA transferase [Phenylobacterium sp.]
MDRLLSPLNVVEASRGVAVRFCGRLFAQMGAAVVRASGGDDAAIGYGGAAGEAYGRWLDAGKRSEPPGAAVDLVIAGQDAQGVAEGEALAARLPGQPVVLAVRWFHADGPYADWRGTDEIIQALSGLAYSLGPPEGPPTLAQGHGPQIAAGLAGFNAALGALMARPRPRRIELNILEAYACLVETGAVSALMEGGTSVRLGVNRLVPTFPCSSYRTADGWAGVSALTPAQWRGLCEIIGRPELGHEPRFATAVGRLMLADEVDGLCAPPFLDRTTDEWVALGGRARVPITPMPDLAELPDTPHWRERGAFGPFDSSGIAAPTRPYRATFGGPCAPVPAGDARAPLRGLRVVDFSMGWAGPLCARTLADLGADVVKIESAGHPDWWRGWEVEQGDPPPHETKFNFICMNRNKRGVALDLASTEGLARARALVAGADVVVENFAAGIMDRLGLGPDVRRALNPGLITVSMPAFGNGGPLSGIRAYGSTVEQASGLPFANGRPEWPPSLQHVAFGDPLAGLTAANAVMACLFGRERTGGAEIDLAQVASLFQFAADAIIAQHFVSGPLPRTGSRRARAAAFVVAGAEPDSWLAVAADTAAALDGLRARLGRPDLSRADEDGIEAALAAWACTRTPEDAAAALQAAGVPAAPVQRADQLCYDPQLTAGGFWLESERRYVGAHLIPAAPFAYDGVRPAVRWPAPTLGEHTDEVLRELDATA